MNSCDNCGSKYDEANSGSGWLCPYCYAAMKTKPETPEGKVVDDIACMFNALEARLKEYIQDATK
jgi:DNA-directed RNA polymerase subunit RPC12/RpoP